MPFLKSRSNTRIIGVSGTAPLIRRRGFVQDVDAQAVTFARMEAKLTQLTKAVAPPYELDTFTLICLPIQIRFISLAHERRWIVKTRAGVEIQTVIVELSARTRANYNTLPNSRRTFHAAK